MEDPENVDYLAVELVYEVLVLPVAISVDTGLTWLALSAFWAVLTFPYFILKIISRGVLMVFPERWILFAPAGGKRCSLL